MKNLISIIFVLYFVNTNNAQTNDVGGFDQQCKNWKFTEVVENPGTAEQIYLKCKVWGLANIPGVNIIEDNKNEYRLVYSGIFQTDGIYHGEVHFLMTVEFKENKYRYTIEQFNHKKGEVVNGFHTTPTNTGAKYFDYGSLISDKPPISGMLTGHYARCWEKIKEIAKESTLKMIISLKNSLKDNETKTNW